MDDNYTICANFTEVTAETTGIVSLSAWQAITINISFPRLGVYFTE